MRQDAVRVAYIDSRDDRKNDAKYVFDPGGQSFLSSRRLYVRHCFYCCIIYRVHPDLEWQWMRCMGDPDISSLDAPLASKILLLGTTI